MPFCTSCGAQMDEAARFCTSCGALVDQAGPAPEPESEPDRLSPGENKGFDPAAVPDPQPFSSAEPARGFRAEPEAPIPPAPPLIEGKNGARRSRPRREESRDPAFERHAPLSPRADLHGGGFLSALSMAGFFWTLFLFCIPVIGQIVAGIWALGGSRNQNRRNLSKAFLLLSLIALVIAAIAYLLLRLFPEELLGWLPYDVRYFIRSTLYLW